jgi:hypothetical protein
MRHAYDDGGLALGAAKLQHEGQLDSLEERFEERAQDVEADCVGYDRDLTATALLL